jgi:glycosyltransferase involved in cell wall biosynthesis
MRIAIMMRAMDQDSGLRSYVEGLVEEMLRLDSSNRYILLYRTKKLLGRFAGIANVTERLLRAPHKFLWDQLAVPWAAWRERADVIFNPKFSVPLVSSCAVAMGIQPPDWYSWPEHYERFDVFYMQLMLPFYIRKCAYLFPMSQFNLDETKRYVEHPFTNATVTYTAPAKQIRRIEDASALAAFRRKYGLPDRLILGLARVGHVGLEGSESFYEGKNVDTTVKAFLQCRDQIPHDLVLTGFRVREYLEYKGFRGSDLDRIHTVGFLPYQEIPYVYSVADVVVIPSFYEGTSITLMEAMACGCPVIASQTGACPEVAGGAALLGNPHDPADFASKIVQVLKDPSLRESMQEKSLERAKFFTWERCARLTLEGLEKAVRR